MSKNLTKKIAIVILIILLFSFIAPFNSSQAVSFAGVINKPITSFCMLILDGINTLLTLLLQGQDAFNQAEAALQQDNEAIIQQYLIDPSKIFANEVPMLNANIFEANTKVGEEFGTSGDSLGVILKKVVSGTYEVIRNLSAVILLVLLIYTGIRILLASNSAQEKAKWNGILLDWVKALALVIFIHVIMIGTFWISDKLVDAIMGVTSGGNSFIAQIRIAFKDLEWDGATLSYWVLVIMYGYITYLTIVFALAYLKRLMYLVVLIVIAPIVAVTYALGGQQKQIFSKWLKNYIMSVLLQPFHVLIYYILISLPLSMLNTPASDKFFDGRNFACIYALVAMSFIKPAQKLLSDLFGMDEGINRFAGSFESGKAMFDKGKQLVIGAGELAAGVMTGNPALLRDGMRRVTNPAPSSATNPEDEEPAPMADGLPDGNSPTEDGLPDGNAPNGSAPNARAPKNKPITENDIIEPPEKRSLTDRLADIIRDGDFHNIPTRFEEGIINSKPYQGVKKIKDGAKKGLRNFKNNAVGKIEDSNSKILHGGLSAARKTHQIGAAIADRGKSSWGYLTSDMGKEQLLNVLNLAAKFSAAFGSRDNNVSENVGSMFRDRAEKIKKDGENTANAFVEDNRHIQFVKNHYGLQGEKADDKAKAILKDASEFLKYGDYGDIGLAVTLLDYKNEHNLSHGQAIKEFSKSEEYKSAVRVNNFINNSVQVNKLREKVASEMAPGRTIAQIKNDNPELLRQIEQKVSAEIKNALPYIASGTAKNASDVQRLNNLEEKIKKAKVVKDGDIKKITETTEKVIAQALKDGLGEVSLSKNGENKSKSMETLEDIATTELKARMPQRPNT